MPEEVSTEAVVSRPVVDVLQEQTDLLRSIDHKVDGKADKSDLVSLINKVDGHGDRLVSLEVTRDWSRRLWAAGGVLLLAGTGLVAGLFGGHVI